MPNAVAWSIIAVLVGLLVGNFFYREHKAAERFNAAADAFRETFQPAIKALLIQGANPRRVLQNEFPKHREAVILFAVHIGRFRLFRRYGFRKAWGEYCVYYGNHVQAQSAAPTEKETLGHIYALLDYAKPK
jgi:hypothetical protein